MILIFYPFTAFAALCISLGSRCGSCDQDDIVSAIDDSIASLVDARLSVEGYYLHAVHTQQLMSYNCEIV